MLHRDTFSLAVVGTAWPLVMVLALAAPGTVAAEPAKCQREIAKQSAKLVQVRTKHLASCEASKLGGKRPSGTDCPTDPKIATKLANAEAKLSAGIAKACGGPVTSLEDLVACAQCVVDFKGRCFDAVTVPALVAFPPEHQLHGRLLLRRRLRECGADRAHADAGRRSRRPDAHLRSLRDRAESVALGLPLPDRVRGGRSRDGARYGDDRVQPGGAVSRKGTVRGGK